MSNWRNTREYRIWRVGVTRRDKRCVICDSIKKRHAHHLNSGSYFPDERFNMLNGIYLYSVCHISLFHGLFMGGTRKKTVKKDFDKFSLLLFKHDKMKGELK